MTPSELQTYLHTHIPLSKAMEVEVVQATPDIIELRAPLAPNINHRGTAFGGSISTLATAETDASASPRKPRVPMLSRSYS